MIKRVWAWARRKIFSTTFLKFGIVGASGVVVNYGIAYLGYIAGLSDIISLAIGVEAAILNNFTWNDLWTFRHRRWECMYGTRLRSKASLVRAWLDGRISSEDLLEAMRMWSSGAD
ncbi:hypothetical protein DRO47_02465 [Candidatus Bathyarchaeota archaeon]|nr:MAG: hypothetical protein DRN59_03190 [Nitrososphaerota archaeon]RLI22548.1 MAG: hypothetical protein DRO47_02465 [Candidatus Bathyarchaeota archaeon]